MDQDAAAKGGAGDDPAHKGADVDASSLNRGRKKDDTSSNEFGRRTGRVGKVPRSGGCCRRHQRGGLPEGRGWGRRKMKVDSFLG